MDATASDIAEMTRDELRLVLVDAQLELSNARDEILFLETAITTAAAAEQLPPRDPEPATATAAEPGDDDPSAEPESPETMFECAADWVNTWMVSMTARTFPAWCEQWWLHPEAEIRIDAMWRTWELARIHPNPITMSTWLLQHFDTHIAALSDSEGPFTQCGRHHHTLPRTEINPTLAMDVAEAF